MEESDYLAAVLERAAHGARRDELAAILVDDEVTLEEARAFIDELIDSRLLVSDLHVQVTGAEPVSALADRLTPRAETRELSTRRPAPWTR